MITDIENCYGCKACEQVCPVKCISMKTDGEGFLYPETDESLCTGCNMCNRVCPMTKDLFSEEPQSFFCFINKEKNEIKKSSSGGAFSALSRGFCDTAKLKVFGAKWDKDLSVCHEYAESLNGINVFRKSKYIQSDTRNTFSIAREFLDKGETVVYSGTPCQIAGLKGFLGKDYDKLLTIDVICHGVPSQYVFDKYVKSIEEENKSKVESFSFRNRRSVFGVRDSLCVKIKLSDGREIKRFSFKDTYMRGYFARLYYRKCCYGCKFARRQRVSDITIGDFWGIDRLDKKLNPHNGVSLIIASSEKGRKLIEKLSAAHRVKRVSEEDAVRLNKNLSRPSDYNLNRSIFFERLANTGFNTAVNGFIPRISKVKYIVSNVLPENIKRILKAGEE